MVPSGARLDRSHLSNFQCFHCPGAGDVDASASGQLEYRLETRFLIVFDHSRIILGRYPPDILRHLYAQWGQWGSVTPMTQLVCCHTVGLSVDLVEMSRGMVVLVMNSTRFEVNQTMLRTQMVRWYDSAWWNCYCWVHTRHTSHIKRMYNILIHTNFTLILTQYALIGSSLMSLAYASTQDIQ